MVEVVLTDGKRVTLRGSTIDEVFQNTDATGRWTFLECEPLDGIQRTPSGPSSKTVRRCVVNIDHVIRVEETS